MISLRAIALPAWAAALLAAALCAVRLFKSPYGSGLDAWAIWGVKARFIYAGQWGALFDPSLDFTHTNYPPFYPLLSAAGWRIAGSESAAVGWIIAMGFTAATAGFLTQAVYRLSPAWAWLAAAGIVFTPVVTGVGASQYADILIAFFMLAAVLEAQKDDRPGSVTASGLLAGMAALTKNEGLAFAAVLGLAVFVFKRRSFGRFITGCSVPLLAVAAVKWQAGFLQDSFGFLPPAALWLSRTKQIALSLLESAFNENLWVYAWFFVAGVFTVKAPTVFLDRRLLFLWFVVLGMGAVYAAVFFFSSFGLEAHLETAKDRLLLQLFPVSLYAAFATLAEPQNAPQNTQNRVAV